MSAVALETALRGFSRRFDSQITLQHVEDLLEPDAAQTTTQHSSNDSTVAADGDALATLTYARDARQNHDTLVHKLLALSHKCSQLAGDVAADRQALSWERLVNVDDAGSVVPIVPDSLLAYFTSLVHLPTAHKTNSALRRLAIVAARCYVQLLCTPTEAQVYGVFHEPLVQRVCSLFGLLQSDCWSTIRTQSDRTDLLSNCIELIVALDQMLGVCSLAGCEELKRCLVRAVRSCLSHYLDAGQQSKDTQSLHERCYDVLNRLCHQRHGTTADTLALIMRNVANLQPRFPLARLHQLNANITTATAIIGEAQSQVAESLPHWFLMRLESPASPVAAILTLYVQSVLSNADPGIAGNAPGHLEVCCVYETVLWRCGDRMLIDYMCGVLQFSVEGMHRLLVLEFAVRLLSADVLDEDFGTMGTNVPDAQSTGQPAREVQLLRVVLDKLADNSMMIRVKAMNGFLQLSREGNTRVKELLQMVFLRAERTEESDADTPRSHAPTPTQCTPCGLESLQQLYRTELLNTTKQNLNQTSVHVRKHAILMLEFHAQAADSHAFDAFLRSGDMRRLYWDPSTLVRRQLIASADVMLLARPSCPTVLDFYARLMLMLAGDEDQRVMDAVADSFRRNLFDNIAAAAHTLEGERSELPWRLLRALLDAKDVPDVRGCFVGWVNRRLLTAEHLRLIETHVCDEQRAPLAWQLLSMVAAHMHGIAGGRRAEQTDVMRAVLANVSRRVVSSQTLFAQLEVLACWLDGCDSKQRAEVLHTLDDALSTGSVAMCHVARVFEICWRCCRSESVTRKETDASDADGAQIAWAAALSVRVRPIFEPRMRDVLLHGDPMTTQWSGAIFTYVQAVTYLPEARADEEVVQVCQDFLWRVAKREIKFGDSHPQLGLKINHIQLVLTTLSLFNQNVCQDTVKVLGGILKTVKQPHCIVRSIMCLGDLYKKYTSLAETVLPLMLANTQHPNADVRSAALRKITQLVMDEFVKFRGSLLVYTLAALCDADLSCSELARELIFKQRAEKNALLIRSCLLECPFVLNGYSHLDHMDAFGNAAEAQLPSPLIGAGRRADRHQVYRFLVDQVEAVHCYVYFGNVRLFADKLRNQRGPLMQPAGRATVVDFLYVLTYVCRSKERRKEKLSDVASNENAAAAAPNGEADDADGINDLPAIAALPPTASTATAAVNTSGASSKTAGAGRAGRGRNAGPTIEQALLVVEKSLPQIAELAATLCSIDEAAFEPAIGELARAICEHFVALTHMAQPKEFWTHYKRAEEAAAPASSRPAMTKKSLVPSSAHADGSSDDKETADVNSKRSKKAVPLSSSPLAMAQTDGSSDEESAAVKPKRKSGSRRSQPKATAGSDSVHGFVVSSQRRSGSDRRPKTPTSSDRPKRSSAAGRRSNGADDRSDSADSDGDFVRPQPFTAGPQRSRPGASPTVQPLRLRRDCSATQSETENEIERRAVRLARKKRQ